VRIRTLRTLCVYATEGHSLHVETLKEVTHILLACLSTGGGWLAGW